MRRDTLGYVYTRTRRTPRTISDDDCLQYVQLRCSCSLLDRGTNFNDDIVGKCTFVAGRNLGEVAAMYGWTRNGGIAEYLDFGFVTDEKHML